LFVNRKKNKLFKKNFWYSLFKILCLTYFEKNFESDVNFLSYF
jgi:hypothetical protein